MEMFIFGRPKWDSLKRHKIQGTVGSTVSGTHSLAAILSVSLQPANMFLNKSPGVQPPEQETTMQPFHKANQQHPGLHELQGQGRGPLPFAQHFWDDSCSTISSLGLHSVRRALKVQQNQQKPTRMVRGLEHMVWDKRARKFVCSARRDNWLHSPTIQKVTEKVQTGCSWRCTAEGQRKQAQGAARKTTLGWRQKRSSEWLSPGTGAQRAWSISTLGDIHMDKDISDITLPRSQLALSWSGTQRPKKLPFSKLPQLGHEKLLCSEC